MRSSVQRIVAVILGVSSLSGTTAITAGAQSCARVNALYIPLADHYAAVVAFERYADEIIQPTFGLNR